MVGMASELEKIEEIKKYIEATIAEIDSHTENMEKLFKMDKWSRDRELYEIIINSYERHRNTLKRIQKMVEDGKVESGLYTLSTKSEIDMVKERIEKLENDLMKKHMENSESKLSDSEILDGFSEIKSGEAGRMSERKPKESNP
jgi:protein subunit release factor A